ncbi:hypothetical protein BU15DRAFT_76418 [Melanogaster broomeanus]|nr:hypothetical protein BU15DRAFT_76418 [Melanogaster broomeanus]
MDRRLKNRPRGLEIGLHPKSGPITSKTYPSPPNVPIASKTTRHSKTPALPIPVASKTYLSPKNLLVASKAYHRAQNQPSPQKGTYRFKNIIVRLKNIPAASKMSSSTSKAYPQAQNGPRRIENILIVSKTCCTQTPGRWIIEDLGGRAESSTSDRPPSAPLESHTGLSKTWADASSPERRQTDPRARHSRGSEAIQPSSGYTDDRTIAHEHRDESEVELEGRNMHASAPNASATVVHSPANAPRGLFEGEQGGWKSTSHTHERSTAQRCHKRQAAKGTHQEATEWAGSTTMSTRPRAA